MNEGPNYYEFSMGLVPFYELIWNSEFKLIYMLSLCQIKLVLTKLWSTHESIYNMTLTFFK